MRFQTVTGLASVEDVRLADGHGHVWIQPPEGAEVRLELNHPELIELELKDFSRAGGTTIVDCQPGDCGRDARMLVRLANATGLQITATTGFHQRKYYPTGHWLWSATATEAAKYFVRELTVGMQETDNGVPATTIKVGYEGSIEGQTRILMEAAAEAGRQTGAVILFHTEQGKNIEALPPFFEERGIPPSQLYLCHVDKRPDFGLHRELAQAGVLLGYDTFVRPRYKPEKNVWRLLEAMLAAGMGDHIAVCLDLALFSMWKHDGGEPGLVTLPAHIVPRLRTMGLEEIEIRKLAGLNVIRRLAQKKEVL